MAMNDRSQQMLQMLSSQNICDGILYEPRIYGQAFQGATAAQPIVESAPEVFRNGENYPVRITHILAAMQYSTGVGADERDIQAFGLAVRAHDTYYMSPKHSPLPLWHNKRVAASDVVTRSTATWKFWKPIYMGARDVFDVKFSLAAAVGEFSGSRRVGVAFNGVGALSRRPKQIVSYRAVVAADGTGELSLNSDDLKNDGLEPLEIHEMVLSVGGESLITPTGDIRLASFSVRQVGNGTNQRWTVGADAAGNDRIPAGLWGCHVGRSIVHELPKGADGHPGWLWYPGMGVKVEVRDFDDAATSGFYPWVAMLGHAIIK